MKKTLFLVGFAVLVYLFFTVGTSFAGDMTQDPLGKESCSAWKKEDGITCIFAGRDASFWRRTCHDEERICKYRVRQPCDAETICMKGNPNDLTTICGDWAEVRSVTCHNEETGDWENKWERACVQHYVQDSACSRTKPSFY